MIRARSQARTSKSRFSRILGTTQKALLGCAVLVLATGVALALREVMHNREANKQAAKLVYQANHNVNHTVPSTTKPTSSTFNSYSVPASNPRYVFIPKLSVEAVVRPLGVTKDDQLDAPSNVFDVGWYMGSSKPGRPGAVVLDGHVSSWTSNGVFYGLKTLKPHDTIQIETGDGSKVSYTVIKSQIYSSDQVDMAAVLTPIHSTKPGLNIITCSGDVIAGTNEFNKRIVVFAEQT